MRRATGHTVRVIADGREVDAFVPYPLPPANPDLQFSYGLTELMEAAGYALGRLDQVASEFPDPNLPIKWQRTRGCHCQLCSQH